MVQQVEQLSTGYAQLEKFVEDERVFCHQCSKAVEVDMKQSMHQLEWADIYQVVPMADQSYSRRAVGAAIFQRFCQDQSSSGWVQIK